jgi:ribosomal protein L7/L12
MTGQDAMTKKSAPPYPYDQRTDTITLPPEIEKELRQLVMSGNIILAVQRVRELTGAGLKVSKDYVDSLPGRK